MGHVCHSEESSVDCRHVPCSQEDPIWGARTTRASFVGPLPQAPISSVVKRSIPVDQGTHQCLRLMNLDIDKPKNLDKGGSRGWAECNSHPQGLCFLRHGERLCNSDSSFSGSDSSFVALVSSFPWQPPLPHPQHLNEMAPKAQGVHTRSSSARVSCQGHGETLGGRADAQPCGVRLRLQLLSSWGGLTGAPPEVNCC